MKKILVLEGFKRNYRCEDKKNSHCPYMNNIHDLETDDPIDWRDILYGAMDQVSEGNIVRLLIEDTGEKAEMGYDWWCLLGPNNYGPHSALDNRDDKS